MQNEMLIIDQQQRFPFHGSLSFGIRYLHRKPEKWFSTTLHPACTLPSICNHIDRRMFSLFENKVPRLSSPVST
jgi:hypothetical protein